MERVPTLIESLATALVERGCTLVTAESCTGGLIAAACTEGAGASAWFEGGFVTYSNKAKERMLGVPSATLAAYGAVSEPTARAMCEGALLHSGARLSVAVTGIAGPSGATADKPVGTVCFGWAWREGGAADGQIQSHTSTRHFKGERAAVRAQSVRFALEKGLESLRLINPHTTTLSPQTGALICGSTSKASNPSDSCQPR